MAITPRSTSPETWLVGDIGATNARFGLVSPRGEQLHTRTLPVHDYPTIFDAIIAYVGERGGLPMPRQGAIAIASAITGDRVAMTNHPWSFSISALQAQLGWWRMIRRSRQRELANEYIGQLGIKARDAEQPIGLLSGGNQQKVLLARWLATKPRLLILDEPTRGIDVAAKFEIMDRVRALCAKGLGILFISSEISEVVRVSDRIAVLRDRRKVAELSGAARSEHEIYDLIAGDRR